MTNSIDNCDNIIDSRDVIARIEELESDYESLKEDAEFDEDKDQDDHLKALAALDAWDTSEEGEELASLKALAEQCEGYGDWEHGETLIAESYFVEYCEELCKDIGDIPKVIPDYIEIDWEKTAENLKQDYMEVDFGGTAYFMRS